MRRGRRPRPAARRDGFGRMLVGAFESFRFRKHNVAGRCSALCRQKAAAAQLPYAVLFSDTFPFVSCRPPLSLAGDQAHELQLHLARADPPGHAQHAGLGRPQGAQQVRKSDTEVVFGCGGLPGQAPALERKRGVSTCTAFFFSDPLHLRLSCAVPAPFAPPWWQRARVRSGRATAPARRLGETCRPPPPLPPPNTHVASLSISLRHPPSLSLPVSLPPLLATAQTATLNHPPSPPPATRHVALLPTGWVSMWRR